MQIHYFMNGDVIYVVQGENQADAEAHLARNLDLAPEEVEEYRNQGHANLTPAIGIIGIVAGKRIMLYGAPFEKATVYQPYSIRE